MDYQRPKIGLALSGGGAKGAAHVGVLKYLEQHQIGIDYIAGTSIGAYVGGLYALGYSAADIEQVMLSLDWQSGFFDEAPRHALSYRDKQHKDRFNIPLNIGISQGEVVMPKGLLSGQSMSKLYLQSVGITENYASFDQLAIPYRALATNIATGKALVIASGNMIDAMQASASVPGILQPIEIDGKYLVDGGISSNLPIDVVRQMGADIVIAVDIGSKLSDESQLKTGIAIVSQLSTILTRTNTLEEINHLSSKDTLIRPDIDNIDTTDFSAIPKGFTLGYQAAKQHAKSLSALSLGEQSYQQYLTGKKRFRNHTQAIAEHPVAGITVHCQQSHLIPLIDSQMPDQQQPLSVTEILSVVDKVYAINEFERVHVEFETIADPALGQNTKQMHLYAKPKKWQSNFFDLGIAWEGDSEHASKLYFDLAYTMRQLNSDSDELRVEIQSGNQQQLAINYYRPLSATHKWYSESRFELAKQQQNYRTDETLWFADNKYHAFSTELGYSPVNNSQMAIGMAYDKGKLDVANLSSYDHDYENVGGYISLRYDSLDSYLFPSTGLKLDATVHYYRDQRSQDNVSEDEHHTAASLNIKYAKSWQQHALVSHLNIGTNNSDHLDPAHAYTLGGLFHLSGSEQDALFGNEVLLASLMYHYRFDWQGFGITTPIFVGASYEVGNIWQTHAQRDWQDLIKAGSVFIGTETSFGPAILAVGHNELSQSTWYLSLGKRF
ncbi:patatin-like phospholipase family protein [Shewanella waksmanii]|uniref:patatin-like phospholipase family protein n=1 Tax=Shewanella waksmanii TaxID=213783 RepID=UPI003736D375